MMISRRQALWGMGAAIAASGWVQAAQRQSLADPLRLAVDDALFESGLATAFQKAFGRDTGVAVSLSHGPATPVLEALERGEYDAALTNAPAVEENLDKQGFVHDRRLITQGDFILVGPTVLAKPLDAKHDVALALQRLSQAAVPFMTRPDGSGTHLGEQAAWRTAKVDPKAPWYLTADGKSPIVAQAMKANACLFVEHGMWLAQGAGMAGKGYGVLVAGDPRLDEQVHVMRTFRAERQHPAGKLFVAWISGSKGRGVVASHRGYKAAR